MTSALATTRAELILEAFDRRQQSLAQRLEGLLALRDRVETLTEETHAIARALSQAAPAPEQAHAASLGAEDSVYVAFENRYRGSREELRERLVEYVDMFRDLGPVVDVGCGRGEFLELLRDAGVSARGVDANASAVGECQARGLDVSQGDLMPYVERLSDGAVGGLFAAQVAEHLPPSVLMALLRESYRALRRGGLLVLETVNPRSVVGFFDLYTRDLTHERPLHPDTLSFLAAAAGFSETRILWRAPVEPAAQLQRIPTDGLPEAAAQLLNENVARLNGLLYAPQEYALLARR
jgi:O-antigen chain-terminating methyltransferase